MSSALYSALAGPNVPEPQRRRRDAVLLLLRAGDPRPLLTVHGLLERFGEVSGESYNYDLAAGDLRELERYGLVRSVGHPKVWSAAGG